jgi:hypothetical protein
MSDVSKIIALVVLVIAIIVFGPLITIWSLNTLFPILAIEYTIASWFAAFWLFAAVAYKGKK